MSKHTPGPWRAAPEETPQDEGWFVKSSSRPYVASVLWGANTAETEANAQLIAAAPELLEALILVRDYVVVMKMMGHEYQVAIDAAISKATGE